MSMTQPFDHTLKSAYQAAVDHKQCRHVLESAADIASTPEHHRFLAHAWWDLLQDKDQAVAALHKSTINGDSEAWTQRCDQLIELFGPQARHHLIDVLQELSDIKDFEIINDRILMLACEALGTPESPIRETDLYPFIEITETWSNSHDEFHACALEWLYVRSKGSNVDSRIIACAKKMEEHATNSYEWLCCAETWSFLGNKHVQDIRRCLATAWRTAEHPRDRRHIATLACGMEVTDEERWRSIKYLEEQAKTDTSWRLCAELWIRHLRSWSNSKRCLRLARQAPPGRFGDF